MANNKYEGLTDTVTGTVENKGTDEKTIVLDKPYGHKSRPALAASVSPETENAETLVAGQRVEAEVTEIRGRCVATNINKVLPPAP